MTNRVLMVVTSHSAMGSSGKTTGIWADELAAPYNLFVDKGFEVAIVSPAGGRARFDPNSIKPQGQNGPELERFLADPTAQRLAGEMMPASAVDPNRYDAVFFPGGHGAMWDLPNDPDVRSIVETAFATNKLIAAVCHGPAALLGATRADGKSVLYGRRVNAFTNDEETAAGLSDVVPFMLETRMRELGGQFEKASNWQGYAVQDDRLITGQNPNSSALVAQKLVDALLDYHSQVAALRLCQ
jgi:putative intracellular protease/amidase